MRGMTIRSGTRTPDILATGSRLKRVAGDLLDLIFPPMTLDDGARSLSGGLSAEVWSRKSVV